MLLSELLDRKAADLLVRKTAYELARELAEAIAERDRLRRENDDLLFDHRRILIANAAAAAMPWKPPIPTEEIPEDESPDGA